MKTQLQISLKSLSQSKLSVLAQKLDTSEEYLMGHIYYSRRVPNKKMMSELQASLKLTDSDMYAHFYKRKAA